MKSRGRRKLKVTEREKNTEESQHGKKKDNRTASVRQVVER